MKRFLNTVFLVFLSGLSAPGQEKPEHEEATFRVLGLFMEVRVDAFKKEIEKHEEIELIGLDYEAGEARLRLFGHVRLRDGTAEQQLRALNERVRLRSQGAFEMAPPQEKPLSERAKIEIPISGLDCLGCSFGAYRVVYKMEGVCRVTADFGERLLVAWIDPEVTSREVIEAELVRKKVIVVGKEDG